MTMVRDESDFQSQIEAAVGTYTLTQARLATAPAGPACGDLYTFPVTANEGIEWALIRQHRDNDLLWFMLPFDQNPLVGTWDVAVSELADAGPGTLRCGSGIWIHTTDLTKGQRSGFLDDRTVQTARKRLSELVRGVEPTPVDISANISAVDDDPEYQDWIDVVAGLADNFARLLREETPVVVARSFRRQSFSQEREASLEGYSLSASSDKNETDLYFRSEDGIEVYLTANSDPDQYTVYFPQAPQGQIAIRIAGQEIPLTGTPSDQSAAVSSLTVSRAAISPLLSDEETFEIIADFSVQ